MARGARSAEAGPRGPGKSGLYPPALKLILFTGALIVLYLLLSQAWRLVSPSRTAVLTPGDLKRIYLAEGLLIRDETVVVSPAGGQLNVLVQEGERVRGGESVAEVRTLAGEPAKSERTALIRAPRSGVVIYRTDGLEGLLNPGQVDILEVAGSRLKSGEGAGRDEVKNGRCEKGQPVMKIVDNLVPVVICLQAPDGFPPGLLKKGGSLNINWENSGFSGRIDQVRDYQGRPQLIIQALSHPPGFLQKRRVVLGLEAGTVSGFLVPVGSLVEKNGQKGINIMNKNRVTWAPVKVEGVVNDTAAVSGAGLASGVRYQANPRRLFNKV